MAATDAELVDGALAGSQQAFRELVRRYERAVFAVIVRMLRDPSRAEELAQDTFVKAFRSLHTYDTERKLVAWLLTIAHHTAIDEIRKHGIDAAELDPETPDRGQPSPHHLAERAERTAALRTAIARLRPEYRELVSLKYEQELEYDDIVQITGIPIGTVKSSLHRARKELVEHLEALGWRH